MRKKHFLLEWFILNLIGFTLGSLHGATDNGLIPSIVPGIIGLILGDLFFGAMVGFAQYLAFRRTKFLPIPVAWVVTTSLGFTLGARAGALLTYRLTSDLTTAGIIFGVFMGGGIGLITASVLFNRFAPKPMAVWLTTTTLAWIAGESIAFASNFSFATVPLVAVAIAGITGLGLVYLQPVLRPTSQD